MASRLRGIAELLFRLLVLLLAAGVLLWGGGRLVHEAPPVYVPTRISVALAPGEARVLGRAELAAPAADAAHVRLRHDRSGQWWLRNVSPTRALLHRRDDQERAVQSLLLTTGDRFALAGVRFEVMAVNGRRLSLRRPDGGEVETDGVQVWHRVGDVRADSPACPPRGVLEATEQRARSLWNRLLPAVFGVPQPLSLGGLIDCGPHVAIAGTAPGLAHIARDPAGNYVLSASPAAARAICQSPAPNGDCPDDQFLSTREQDLAVGDRLVLGRTAYRVDAVADVLVLTPLTRVRLLATPEIPVADGVSWDIEPHSPGRWAFGTDPWVLIGGGLVLSLFGGIVAQSLFWRRGVSVMRGVVLTALIVLAAFAASLYLAGSTGTGAFWPLGLLALAAGAALLAPAGNGLTLLARSAATLLLLGGSAVQLHLGLAAGDSGGLRFFHAMATLSALALLLWALLARMRLHWSRDAVAAWIPGLALGALPLALLGLAAQTLLGDEGGVLGVQPVEFAKFALLAVAAYGLAARLDFEHQGFLARSKAFLLLLSPLLLLGLLVATALFLLRDFSPLVLIAGWGVGLTLAWALASGRPLAWAFTVSAAVLLVLAYQALADGQIGDRAVLYAERFAVWHQPALHPHTGDQFHRAVQLLADGEAAASLQPWRVPAIQDDFAPTYLIAAFGAPAALAVLWLQVAYVAALALAGWHALTRAGDGDPSASTLGRFRYFVLFGGAALLAAHAVVSWGSNLGLLPVMGQPMPMLSAAGSLIVLFLLPLQAVAELEPTVPPGKYTGKH